MNKKLLLFIGVVAVISSSSAQKSSSDEVNGRTLERRAAEAVIWGMPAVNYDLMLQEMLTKTAAKVMRSSTGRSPLTGRTRR